MNRSQKRPLIFATRDFPPGCGTARQDHTISAARQDHTIAAAREPSVKRRSADQDRVVAASTARASSSSHRKNPEIRNSGADDPIARQKVNEVRSLFKQIYRQLDQDKQARRGGDVGEATSRIDLKTQHVIDSMGKQINTEKRIGSVPGIRVGDEFQYKTELRVVGLHSKPMCGIDYMTTMGDVKLATSIVSSEGYGYNNSFKSGVLIYTGEGGNVMSKGKNTEDQKLVKGNLALANSKREKRAVRVILGEERWDGKGKRYIYDGLYTVEEYWLEKEDRGKLVYKFKLCRIPGQPPST